MVHERHTNDDLRIQLHKLNDQIDYNTKNLHDKRARIAHLHDLIDKSKQAQDGLNCSLNVREDDNKVKHHLINDNNDKIRMLEDQICDKLNQITDLKHRIAVENDSANCLSRDKDTFAIKNSNLNSAISSLKLAMEDRHREMCALNRELADLNDLYHRRKVDNEALECNINSLSHHVSHLTCQNRGIGHELVHAADREAYRYGTYGKASYIHHKTADFGYEARHSAHHVEHVRANSPARSPVRRYY